MRLSFALLFLSSCAQPDTNTGFDSHRAGDMGRHLQFDDDGGTTFGSNDLSGGGTTADLAQPAALPDLALPNGAVDLAGRDMAGAAAVDMATPPVCATVENCFNNLDDDCNGAINNGCPDTISTGADVPLTSYGGVGGGAVTAHCPANQVVVGLRIYFYDYDGYISGVGLACAPVTLVRGASSYSLQINQPSSLSQAFAGSDTDSSEDYPCGANQPVWTTITDAGKYIYGLNFSCGRSTLALSATNQLSIGFADNNDNFGWDYFGGTVNSQSCGASQAIVGYNGHDGGWLDQLQPICAPLTVNYK